MNKTKKLYEIKNESYEEDKKRKEAERKEIEGILRDEIKKSLDIELLKVEFIEPEEEEHSIRIEYSFELDDYAQQDSDHWWENESLNEFIDGLKKSIGYIRELRNQYPEYAKQNDYIQSKRKYSKHLKLTHMGYGRLYNFSVELADYLKLPNTTNCGFGGGDYRIRQTPERVKEFNKNIDKTIDFMIDCISELRQMKFMEQVEKIETTDEEDED